MAIPFSSHRRIPTLKAKDFSLSGVAKAVFSQMDRHDRSSQNGRSAQSPRQGRNLAYSDLTRFSAVCKKSFPNVAQCVVCFEMMENNALFRVTQVMQDAFGAPVKNQAGETLGRVFYVTQFDAQVHAALKGVIPAEFSYHVV